MVAFISSFRTGAIPVQLRAMSENTHSRHKHNWTFWALLLVLLLAAYLRIHDLNDQGMWGDEGWSIWLARGDSLQDLTDTMVVDHHGPVFSSLLRGWDYFAGQQVVALRYLTVLFSVASIALIARLGRELVNPAAGVGAALAFTLMDKHVVLTQEVRDYPMVFFMMLLVAYFYMRWWRTARTGTSAPGAAFGFVAASVIGLYLHYYVYMTNIAILIHALITLRGESRGRTRALWRHFLAQNALIALAFAPWLPVVVHQFVWTPVDEIVLSTHGMPLNRHTIDYLARESLGTPIALYGLLMLVGAVAPFLRRAYLPGSLGDVAHGRRTSGALLAALWFLVPVTITLALHSRYPLLTDRNISVIMPGIALLVGIGFTAFERAGAAFLVTLVLVNGLLTTSSYFDKPPWREMATDIADYYPGDEPVLIDVEGAHAVAWYHLSLELPVEVAEVVDLLPAEADAQDADLAISLYDLRKRYRGDFIPKLQAEIADAAGVWLAYWGDPAKKHDVFDVLDSAGFVRTATLPYEHHGNPIYAYRYDRAQTLESGLVTFEGGITLGKVALPESVRAGEDLNALLWWTAPQTPPVDYSVSVILIGGGRVLNHDSYPQNGARPTSTWEPGAAVFDPHTLALPDDLPPGEYEVRVKLYTWWDGAILPLADGTVSDVGALVGTVRVE